MTENDPDIKVSVCVVTYNQVEYIEQCLHSLIDQVTNFKFEIIVGDDYSTDGTRLKIKDIASKNEFVKLNFSSKNVGTVKNILSTYKMAKGKYICHIDGDDYVLPGKLQAQFDALELNKDCNICTHDVRQVTKDDSLIRNSFNMKPTGKYGLKDLLSDLPFFAHSSKMFVNTFDPFFGEDFTDTTLDIEVHVSQLADKHIIHLCTPLGAYRVFTGVSSTSRTVNKNLIEGCNRVFSAAYKNDSINEIFYRKCHALALYKFAYQSAIYGDIKGLKENINNSINICKFSLGQFVFYVLSCIPMFVIFLCKLRAKLKGFNL